MKHWFISSLKSANLEKTVYYLFFIHFHSTYDKTINGSLKAIRQTRNLSQIIVVMPECAEYQTTDAYS